MERSKPHPHKNFTLDSSCTTYVDREGYCRNEAEELDLRWMCLNRLWRHLFFARRPCTIFFYVQTHQLVFLFIFLTLMIYIIMDKRFILYKYILDLKLHFAWSTTAQANKILHFKSPSVRTCLFLHGLLCHKRRLREIRWVDITRSCSLNALIDS